MSGHEDKENHRPHSRRANICGSMKDEVIAGLTRVGCCKTTWGVGVEPTQTLTLRHAAEHVKAYYSQRFMELIKLMDLFLEATDSPVNEHSNMSRKWRERYLFAKS